MKDSVVYDGSESYVYGRRGVDYTVLGGGSIRFSRSGRIFGRYLLYQDRMVLKYFSFIARTIALKDIEKVSFWYSLTGAKAQVFLKGSDSTVILSTEHPVELGTTFDNLGVKVETAESII